MCVCRGRRIVQRNEKNLGTNIDRGATHPWLSRPAPEAEVVIRTGEAGFSRVILTGHYTGKW